MLLRSCLLHTNMIVSRHAMFCTFVCRSTSRYINYIIYFSLTFSLKLIIKSFLNNHTCLLANFCQQFSLRLLLFCHFQSGFAYKSVAYNKNPCTTVVMLFILGISSSTENASGNKGMGVRRRVI